jgi:hypothetical protein
MKEKNILLSCLCCKQEFYRLARIHRKYIKKGCVKIFCSVLCSTQYSKSQVSYIDCIVCDTKTKNPKFCSSSCSASFNNKGKQKNKPVKRKCKKCFIDYENNKNFVSKMLCKGCSDIYKDRTNYYKSLTVDLYHNMPSVKNKHPSWKSAHIRNFNKSWNKNLTKIPCQVCGYSKHVDLAHIIDIASFPPNATLGEVNHPDNIYALCKNHHWEFDNDFLEESINPR